MGMFALLARTTIGLLFVGDGTQKLFGWFGGGGLDGTGGFFEQLGLRPGRRYALRPVTTGGCSGRARGGPRTSKVAPGPMAPVLSLLSRAPR